MIKKISVLFMCVVLVATLVSTYVSAASPLEISKYDITKTSVGDQIAREAAQRWTGYGWTCDRCDGKELKVYELAPGDYLVAPASAKIELESVKQPDGSVKLEPRIITVSPNGSLLGLETNGVSPMASQYWNLVAAECFARLEGFTGWIDHCYQLHKLMGESDSQKDYFELTHYATAKSKTIFTLKWAKLECVKHSSSSTMEWVDWNPRSDQTRGSCGSITLSVGALGIGISGTFTICKSGWDITKYAEAGKFANKWYGWVWPPSEREVAYMVCVKVPQGGWPVWGLTATFSAVF